MDSEVKYSYKLGVPIVHDYGFLLGELRGLNDLTFRCKYENLILVVQLNNGVFLYCNFCISLMRSLLFF